MKVIGFANKYYTLWDVVIETVTHENYKDEIHHNSYIKNISFDECVKRIIEIENIKTYLKHYPNYMKLIINVDV